MQNPLMSVRKTLDEEPEVTRRPSDAELAALETEVRGLTKQLEAAIADHTGFQDFDQACVAIQKSDQCTLTAAMAKARQAHPALFERYQAEGAASSRPAPEPVQKSNRGADFELRVEAIKARDKCSQTAALQRARREAPAEFEAYQRA